MTQPFSSAGQPRKRLKADALMYGVTFFSWIGIWRVQDVIPILGKIQFPILVELATLALFLTDQTPTRKIKWLRSPLTTMLMAFFAIMVVGLPVSLWAGKGVNFLIWDLLPYLILMTILAGSVRDSSDIEWLAFAHLLGGTAFGIYCYMYCPLGGDGKMGGIPFYDSNDFSLLMVCTIPFAVHFIRPMVKGWKRLFGVGAFGVLVMMTIRSGSRGGFIGLLAVMLYILLQYRAIPSRLRVSAVTVGITVMVVFGSASYWKTMSTILKPEADYNMTEETGRKKIWLRGINYMLTHPLVGVGIRAFPQAEGSLSPVAKRYAAQGRGIKWSVAHNSFVEIGAECGVFALGLFIGMLGYSIYTLARLRAGIRGNPFVTPDDEAFGQTLIASLIGFSVSGFFVSAEYFAYLYVLFGFVLAQHAVIRRRQSRGAAVGGPGVPRAPSPARRPRLPRTQPAHWVPTGS